MNSPQTMRDSLPDSKKANSIEKCTDTGDTLRLSNVGARNTCNSNLQTRKPTE